MKTKLNPLARTNTRRTLITLGAIVALAALIALAAMNAAATPVNPVQLQIRGWITQLQDEKLTAARHNAQRNLELQGEAAVPQLLNALHSNNTTVRRNAADVLSYIASPQSTTALRQVMQNDPAPAVRRNAAYALGEIHDARVLGALYQTSITDTSASVRGAAADSLARTRTILAKNMQRNEQTLGAFAATASQPETIYATAKRDFLTSRDGGKTWQTLPDVLPSQVTALQVNPANAQELYAGTEDLGLFKSSDGGKSWHALNQNIPLTPGAREIISAIAIDPQNPNIIFISRGVWMGTGAVNFYPTGLLSSRDGGATWSALNAGSANASTQAIVKLAFRNGQLYGLAGDRVLTLVTPN